MDILDQPFNRLIRVQPGVNLLKALQEAQVPMSYSCMAGRCGTCRCRVLDGEVMEGSGEAQRPQDGEQGCVLACQTYVTEPCKIEMPEPDEVVPRDIYDMDWLDQLKRGHQGLSVALPLSCSAAQPPRAAGHGPVARKTALKG